jgi:hypothetical protein
VDSEYPALLDCLLLVVRIALTRRRNQAGKSAVDFELFRPELTAALSYTDRTEGGRPPFDPVLMFKILAIQGRRTIFPMNASNFSSMTGCRLCGSWY